MNLQHSTGRQAPLIAKQPFTHEDLDTTDAQNAIILPGNATIIGGGVIVTTAFAGGANNQTLIVGDVDDPDRYTGTPANLAALGYTALDLTGFKYVQRMPVQVTRGGDAPTVGEGIVLVEYVIEDRSQEVQPATLE